MEMLTLFMIHRLPAETAYNIYIDTLQQIENENPNEFQEKILPILQSSYERYAQQPPTTLSLETWLDDMIIDPDYNVHDEFDIQKDIYETALLNIRTQHPGFFTNTVIPIINTVFNNTAPENNINSNNGNNNYNNNIMTNNNINLYSAMQNVGMRNIPKVVNEKGNNITSNVLLDDITNEKNMVNFHDEYKYGRYYTKNSFNKLHKNSSGKKQNPSTRAIIKPENVVKYKAVVKGGSRKTKRTIKKRTIKKRTKY